MRYIRNPEEQLSVCTALGSEVRIEILRLLIRNGRMSMNDLAQSLKLTNGALTPHVKKLESAGLLRIRTDTAGHGNMKICEPHLEKMLFDFTYLKGSQNEYYSHLRVGQYSDFRVYPTCGLSTSESLLGEVDDARYFTHQKRFECDILWFTEGYVEYLIPCVIPKRARIKRLSISAELSSEAPGSNAEWPSDIHFYLNGTLLGIWTSPGDFADVPGLFTPDWWFSNWNQYGLLKTLSVRTDGTYLDNEKISTVTIDSLDLKPDKPMFFRMAVPDTAAHIGGLTIFGRDFGNFNQDIEFHIVYETD